LGGSNFEFTGELWLYPGEAGWFFVTLPLEIADAIDDEVGERAGFGSIPVEVTVGNSTWATSLFPDKTSASFLLPVKKAIRDREHLDVGTVTGFRLRYDSTRT
jgi:hypothetical protein